jgi:hypothetical protein
MTNSIRHTATCMFVAVATCALPAFAQNNAAPAAPAATAINDYGAGLPAPGDRRAKNRDNEQELLGAPPEYGGGDTPQDNTDDAQRAALLDEQRMTVTDGGAGAQRAPRNAQRKAPGAANGQMRAAGQGRPNAAGGQQPQDAAKNPGQMRVAGQGRPTAAEGLLPQGAATNTYADPFGGGKRAIYRSPW